MKNQHRLIKNYRELDQEEVALMNRIKEKGEELSDLIGELLSKNADPRWVAVGRTDLQKGIMALTRAVAKPEGF